MIAASSIGFEQIEKSNTESRDWSMDMDVEFSEQVSSLQNKRKIFKFMKFMNSLISRYLHKMEKMNVDQRKLFSCDLYFLRYL